MRRPYLFLAVFLVVAAYCRAAEIDSLVGNCFKLDKDVTQKYLTDNKVIPDDRIHRMDKFMAHLVVCFEKGTIRTEAWSGTKSSPYKVVLQAKGKIVLEVQDEMGDWRETRITLTEDGYWQETDVFPGYKEKFSPYTKPPEPRPPSNHLQPSSIVRPPLIVRIEDLDKAPHLVSQSAPDYTEDWVRARTAAQATVLLTIEEEGTVSDVILEVCSKPDFGAAAVDAVKKYRFDPITSHGKPARVRIRIAVDGEGSVKFRDQ